MVALALDMGACSVVSIKAGRLGGYLEAVRVHDLCARSKVPAGAAGWSRPGSRESGNVALSRCPISPCPATCRQPAVLRDRSDQPIASAAGWYPGVPDGPGSGVTVDTEAVRVFDLEGLVPAAGCDLRPPAQSQLRCQAWTCSSAGDQAPSQAQTRYRNGTLPRPTSTWTTDAVKRIHWQRRSRGHDPLPTVGIYTKATPCRWPCRIDF